MAKPNLYIDMDGTIAEWEWCGIDVVASKGYFQNRTPMTNVIEALEILKEHFNLVILSAVFNDDHSVEDKKYWLRNFVPFIDVDKAIFVPYGASKYKYLKKVLKKRGEDEDGVFIDDYTKNLVDMRESSSKIIPIKVCNGINDTNRSWDGFRVSSASKAEVIAKSIIGISTAA